MKILLADDDDVARRMIAAALKCSGHEVVALADGGAALDMALASDAPRLLVLDAHMRGARGEDIRRKVQRRADGLYVYVILMTDTTGHQGILDGLDAGADAVLAKPFLPEELLAKIRVAERVLHIETPAAERVLRVLTEAATAGSGEVIVREGEKIGRIFLHNGRVAWAQLSSEPDFVKHLDAEGVRLSRNDVREIIQDCRTTDGNFTEAIVARGLVTADRLREYVQSWIGGRIQAMLRLPHPEVMFLPARRKYNGSITFALDDVLPMETWLQIAPPPRSSSFPRGSAVVQTAWDRAASEMLPPGGGYVKQHLVEALAIEGATAVGLFDGATGACLGAAGKPIPADLAETQIKAMNLLGTQDEIEDMFTTAGTKQYLTRAILPAPRLFLIVVLEREGATIALARLKVANLARRITAERQQQAPPSLRRSVSHSALARVRA